MSANDKTSRILTILKLLNDGKKVTLDYLKTQPSWSSVSSKTIERDINEAFEFLISCIKFVVKFLLALIF